LSPRKISPENKGVVFYSFSELVPECKKLVDADQVDLEFRY
jgi:hypothetical protein